MGSTLKIKLVICPNNHMSIGLKNKGVKDLQCKNNKKRQLGQKKCFLKFIIFPKNYNISKNAYLVSSCKTKH